MIDLELWILLASIVLNAFDQRLIASLGLILSLWIMMHKKESTNVELFRSYSGTMRPKYKVQQTFNAERYPLDAVRGLCDRDDECVALIQIASTDPQEEGTWYGKVVGMRMSDDATNKEAFHNFIRKFKTEQSRKSFMVDVIFDRWSS